VFSNAIILLTVTALALPGIKKRGRQQPGPRCTRSACSTAFRWPGFGMAKYTPPPRAGWRPKFIINFSAAC